MIPAALTFLVILLAHAGLWTPALTLAIPLAWMLGRKSAIRENGRHKVSDGTHQVIWGTW